MIDIQQLIEADKELLLTLNGSSSLFWDGFMWTVSGTKIWIPVGAMLLYIIFKNTQIYSRVAYTRDAGFDCNACRSVLFRSLQTLVYAFPSGSGSGNNVYGECREWLQGRSIWIYIKPCCQYICCSYLCSFAHT